MNSRTKIIGLKTLKKKIAQKRRQKKVIAFTNGCFDILHTGHVSYLEDAKKAGRTLIVGLNSDASVKKNKGPLRPIVPEKQRARVLAALSCVDYVTIFHEDTPAKLIEALRPDVLIKGADWRGKTIAGEDFVRKNGGKIEFIKYIPKVSSTNIISTIAQRCQR